MPLSELNGSIVPIYVDKCRPAESRTWIVVLLCNKSTFQGHVPYVMNNSGLFLFSEEIGDDDRAGSIACDIQGRTSHIKYPVHAGYQRDSIDRQSH